MLIRLLIMRFFQSANVLGVILTLYYRAHGLNYTQILSFEIILSLTMAAATVPLGVWADRHGRVRALKCGSALFMVAAGVFLWAHAYWQFVLSDALYGLGLAWQSGADTALLSAGGTSWFSRYEAVGALAGGASSLLAGWVLQAHGMHALVVLNAAAAGLASLSIATLPHDRPQWAAARSDSPLPGARDAWRHIAAAPWLLAWATAAAVGFRLVGINLMFLDLPLWVSAGWHGVWLGVGVTILYAAGWASLLAPRVQARLDPRLLLTLSQVLAGSLVLVLPTLSSPWALTGFMAGALMLQSLQGPVTHSLMAQALPDPIRVSALSILDLPSLAVTVAGELGVGMLADHSLPLALSASGAAVMAAAVLWWIPRRGSAPQGSAAG